MTEEDEAFEDLAKRQGNWGMQGSRKHQIMRYAENVESKGTSMTDKEAMAKELEELAGKFSEGWHEGIKIDASDIMLLSQAAEVLAQPEQEPVAWWNNTGTHIDLNVSGRGTPLYTHPPQRVEQKMVMWPCLIDTADFSKGTVTIVMQCDDYKVSAGTHWLSTTPPQRT